MITFLYPSGFRHHTVSGGLVLWFRIRARKRLLGKRWVIRAPPIVTASLRGLKRKGTLSPGPVLQKSKLIEVSRLPVDLQIYQ